MRQKVILSFERRNLKEKNEKVTALIIYVNDIIILWDDTEEICKLEKYLVTQFEIKNLEGLKFFLGIEVARSKRVIFLA